MHHAFKIGAAEHNVELSRARTGYRLHLPDRTLPVYLDGWNPTFRTPGTYAIVVDGRQTLVTIATRGDDVFVHLDGAAYQLHYEHPLERLAHQAQGAADASVRAPMPGSLVAVQVKPEQNVMRGEVLLVMESMKMETTLHAAHDGVVQAVHYAPGQTFERDAVLLSFAPALTPPPGEHDSPPLPQGEGEKS